MKIDFKTQTARKTEFKTGVNNINLFLDNFEVGLETRKWGEKEEGEHRITFEIKGNTYSIPLKIFIEKAKVTIKLLSEKYGDTEK